MSHLHEPFKLPVHPALLHKINESMIAIKLHHIPPINDSNLEAYEKAKGNHYIPTWEHVIEILNECYHAINEQRENPIKY